MATSRCRQACGSRDVACQRCRTYQDHQAPHPNNTLAAVLGVVGFLESEVEPAVRLPQDVAAEPLVCPSQGRHWPRSKRHPDVGVALRFHLGLGVHESFSQANARYHLDQEAELVVQQVLDVRLRQAQRLYVQELHRPISARRSLHYDLSTEALAASVEVANQWHNASSRRRLNGWSYRNSSKSCFHCCTESDLI